MVNTVSIIVDGIASFGSFLNTIVRSISITGSWRLTLFPRDTQRAWTSRAPFPVFSNIEREKREGGEGGSEGGKESERERRGR